MIIAAISENQQLLDKIKKIIESENGSQNLEDSNSDNSNKIYIAHGDIHQASAVVEQMHPDIFLIESPLTSKTNLQILSDLAAQFPDMGIFILSQNLTTDVIMEVMRIGVREILPLNLSQQILINAIDRFQKRRLLSKQPISGKVLAFIPCKGGSGSTFIASNLAYILSEHGKKRVLLIDFNLQLGDAALFLSNEKPPATVADIARQIHRLDRAFLASSVLQILPNFHVLAAPDEPEKAIDVTANHIEPILKVATQSYDFVVLDIGRHLDAISIQALDKSDIIFPVIQQTLPFIRDGKRILEVFRSLGYSKNKVRLIVNRYDPKSEITLEDITNTLQMPLFVSIPNNFSVVEYAVNHGEPVLKFSYKSTIAKALIEMANKLCQANNQSENWFKKIFS